MKKPHERPSIGFLLCATKNQEVAEFALSRSMSPALVAEYQTRLPNKKLLQAKLHDFYSLAAPEGDVEIVRQGAARLSGATKKRKAGKKA